MMGPVSKALLFAILGTTAASVHAAEWQATLTKEPPGKLPELRPMHANYRFGWSGFTAGTGEARFAKPSETRCELQGTGRTTGLARALWRYDVTYRAVADARTLRPVESTQTETFKGKKIVTQLSFTAGGGLTRSRTESGVTKSKQVNLPNLYDLHSAMLYLRSQPLKEKSVQRVVAYPNTTPYLATLTVLGREKISVHAGSYNALKIDLKLSKVGKDLQLEPHKKFRRATIWLSDDNDRLILRIEAQIFVGTVFAELQSVRFD
jgi:Protein of unknown function (DUF3108)